MTTTAAAFDPEDFFAIFLDKADSKDGGDLPDLARVIGATAVRKLVRVYGGQEFRIPQWEKVETLLRNLIIWLAIKNKVPAPRMEAQFKVSRQAAHQIHDRVEEIIRNHQARVASGEAAKKVFSDDPVKDLEDLQAWLGADTEGQQLEEESAG